MKIKKGKRLLQMILSSLAALAVILCMALFGINFYVIHSAGSMIITESEADGLKADCILVLGAGVRSDGTPSPMLKDRLDTACRLYKSGAAPKLLMSGDHGKKDYNEVQVMKDYAVALGIPSSDIFMDHAGFSTYESVYRAKEIFQVRKVIAVSQKYHLYRALYTAERLGLDPAGVPADATRYSGQFFRDLREILARDKDFFTVLFRPKPTYLGETIEITGDGNRTNDR